MWDTGIEGSENTWGRVARVSSGGIVEHYSYTQGGAVKKRTLVTGPEAWQKLTAEMTFDNEGRMTGLKMKMPETHYWHSSLGEYKTEETGSYGTTFDAMGRPQKVVYQPAPGLGAAMDVARNAIDASGNLTSKTDARSAVTTMTYDALGRLTAKSYTVPSGVEPTSSVNYTYDQSFAIDGVLTENRPVGRLVRAANGESETVYRYDGLGRPLASRQTTSSTAYVFQYGHVPAGLSATWYPTGRVVRHSFDGAGRIGAVYGEKDANTTWYATGVAYAEHGALERMTVGGSRTEQWCYNDRMQPVAIRLGSSASTNCAYVGGDLLHLSYGYGPDANNNGNVLGQTIQRGVTPATQSYPGFLTGPMAKSRSIWHKQLWKQLFGARRGRPLL